MQDVFQAETNQTTANPRFGAQPQEPQEDQLPEPRMPEDEVLISDSAFEQGVHAVDEDNEAKALRAMELMRSARFRLGRMAA